MTDFVTVIKQYHRMCEAENCNIISNQCPLAETEENDCEYHAYTNPEDFEKRVMEWAAAHPEPKYPTWREWLIRQGFVDFKPYWSPSIPTGNSTITCLSSKALEPIPADTAEKLGIDPEEGYRE